jgi:subtilisin family serine protease
VIKGVDYVGANGVSGDVANMSLGGGVSSALDNAVIAAAAKKGVAFTLAAGNESDTANNHSPARAGGVSSNDTVYTVSAFGQTSDRFASFSNYGNPPIEWAEPGVSVLSTYKGGGYATMSGTSMAAPHLAGILVQGNVSKCGDVTGDRDTNADDIGCH